MYHAIVKRVATRNFTRANEDSQLVAAGPRVFAAHGVGGEALADPILS